LQKLKKCAQVLCSCKISYIGTPNEEGVCQAITPLSVLAVTLPMLV
jgi:hypothetical protein